MLEYTLITLSLLQICLSVSVYSFIYLPFLFVSVQRRSDVAPTFRAEVARPALAANRARHEHVRVRGTNGRGVPIRRQLRLCAHQLHRHHRPALNSIANGETLRLTVKPRSSALLTVCAYRRRTLNSDIEPS